jgi:hypothetical protein
VTRTSVLTLHPVKPSLCRVTPPKALTATANSSKPLLCSKNKGKVRFSLSQLFPSPSSRQPFSAFSGPSEAPRRREQLGLIGRAWGRANDHPVLTESGYDQLLL